VASKQVAGIKVHWESPEEQGRQRGYWGASPTQHPLSSFLNPAIPREPELKKPPQGLVE